jgi:hypothetical protein
MTGSPSSVFEAVESVVLPEVGPVSLVPIDHLRQMRATEEEAAKQFSERATALAAAAEETLADAGAVLVPQRALWPVPPDLKPSMQRAQELVSRIEETDRQLHDAGKGSRGGPVGRLRVWRLHRRLLAARDASSTQLASILSHIARQALAAGLGSPDARPTLDKAQVLEADASEARRAYDSYSRHLAALGEEIQRREESLREMGFDALYTAAHLDRYGPQPVSSPLQLRTGEVAVTAVPCTLARMATRTRYVGARSDLSFRIGHTGIRYRVGSYRGQRVQHQVLRNLDTGTLVVSTQRLAFVGRVKSVVIQLRKVTHVDIYTDALAIFHEGRETADFLLLKAPKYVAFYLNWVLQEVQSG